ncbi:hypothetical protein ACJ72_04032 [Emergomyces africanus]|uniref:Fungal-type protein kinase domain-containing protein n=1 Tax=Emergomyces africanus TaxID=1955775 RepID=A0A1B7NXX2_9EURO|nr:hypothetical protein ACJ72_04032 [Emergomyces africanus]
MPQPTVFESFWEPLPILSISPLPNNATYRTIRASVQSTIAIDAPKAFVLEKASTLLEIAENRLPANVSSLQERMPQVETSHLLHTESDVIRASIQYLLHPINVATSRLVPSSGRLFCRSEAREGGRCRTDLRWIYWDGRRWTNIAVLEFKNTRVLRWSDFKDAVSDQNNASAMVDSAHGASQHHTHFTNNAVWLSKQARKYAETIGAPDVAIFDWDKMFIFNFYGMAEHLRNPVLAKGIWFEEGNNSQQGHTFRMILFGFLVRALQRHGIIT